jgi:cytochrome b561
MSYREKSAWTALITYAVVFGFYFVALWQAWDEAYARGLTIGLTIGTVVMLVIIATTLQTVIALFNPKEAIAAADERETMIDLKAERISSYVLAVGVVLLIGALLMDWSGILVAVLLQASLVISELTKSMAQIAYYRRGA